MSLAEMCVAFLGLVAGYWIVSRLIDRGDGPRSNDANDAAGRGATHPATRPPGTQTPPGNATLPGKSALPSKATLPGKVTLSNWHLILGVSERAARVEIEETYRRRKLDCAPDKLAELNAAYEMGMRLYR